MSEQRDILEIPERRFAQARARKTYEALIDAATEVFGEKGFDDTQTPDIAARAGVSVGSFYRYFADKREAFLEVMQRHMRAGRDAALAELRPERFVGEGRRATIEHTMSVLLDHVTRFPALQRLLLSMSLRDPDVAQLHRRLEDDTVQQMARLVEMICSREQVPDPHATAWVVHTAVVEASIRIAGFRGEPPLPRDRAVRALSQLVFRALFGAEPGEE